MPLGWLRGLLEVVFETRNHFSTGARLPELMLPQQEAKGFVGHRAEISDTEALERII